MSKSTNAALAFVLAIAFSITQAPVAEARKNKDAAKVVGALIGLSIAAAIAEKQRKKEEKIWYQGSSRSFSPRAGVTCYTRLQECYISGRFSMRWTEEIYGY
jgi:hypothetical protein